LDDLNARFNRDRELEHARRDLHLADPDLD
jgi:hypothetical protein